MDDFDDNDIAIIGMALRVPGAGTPDQYWSNLRDGVESLQQFSDDELAARKGAWAQPEKRFERGYGWMFSQHILQADKGCDFDYLESNFGEPVKEPAIY